MLLISTALSLVACVAVFVVVIYQLILIIGIFLVLDLLIYAVGTVFLVYVMALLGHVFYNQIKQGVRIPNVKIFSGRR